MDTQNRTPRQHPVAVLGAGPVGLAAASHLLEQGLEPLVFEANDGPGSTFRDVAHVRLFSPWRYNIDDAARRLLADRAWTPPEPDALPTAGELVTQYLEPLAGHPALAERTRYTGRVVAVTREGMDKVKSADRAESAFVIRTRHRHGGPAEHRASAVVDTTGTWGQPNPLGANGLPVPGEDRFGARIAYGMPDVLGRERTTYSDARVLVVGAGHSAAGTLLALAELADAAPATDIHWALRGAVPERLLGTNSTDDTLPARGALGERLRALVDAGRLTLHPHFPVGALETDGQRRMAVHHAADTRTAPIRGVDRIVAATGTRPDLSLLRELRVRLDPALESVPELAPLVDPNAHSCGTVPPHGYRELVQPEPGLYIAGAKSYGRAPTFLMMTGYEQARSIAAVLAGNTAAAEAVSLALPETGVCGGAATIPSTEPDRPGTTCCSGGA